jgi:hypothetical protein
MISKTKMNPNFYNSIYLKRRKQPKERKKTNLMKVPLS